MGPVASGGARLGRLRAQRPATGRAVVCRMPGHGPVLRAGSADRRGVHHGCVGALAEDDRRALHRVWQRRHQQQDDGMGQEGGPTP